MAENLLSFYLESQEEGSQARSRVNGWEFSGFPCEKCVEQVMTLGVRPIGAKGECLICGETMKSVMLTNEDAALLSEISKGKAGKTGVVHLLFNTNRVANGIPEWLAEKSMELEPEEESTIFGAAVEVNDPAWFDALSFRLGRVDKGVLAVIGTFKEGFENKEPSEDDGEPEEKSDASVKMAERMGYKW